MYAVLLLVLFPLFSASQDKSTQKPKTIVLDAGHGGKDPGTIVGSAKEKNIVLDIALKVGKLLRQHKNTIKVIYTRDGDYFIPLIDRAKIANKSGVDLFISIHANYCETPAINGTETYILGLHRTLDNLNVAKKENSVILLEEDYSTRYEGFNPNLSESYIMFELLQDTHLDQSVKFATILQSNFKQKAQRNDREVRQAGFLVLRETAMPSVLIETGYLSNKKENAYLLSEAGRSEIAESIYRSITEYIDKLENRVYVEPSPGNNEKPSLQTSNQTKTNKDEENIALRSLNRKRQTNLPAAIKSMEKETPSATRQTTITYAIQIIVLNKRKPLDSKIFKGIKPLREIFVLNQYKYYCYESDNLENTQKHFFEVKKFFPDAFLVSITDNQPKMIQGLKLK